MGLFSKGPSRVSGQVRRRTRYLTSPEGFYDFLYGRPGSAAIDPPSGMSFLERAVWESKHPGWRGDPGSRGLLDIFRELAFPEQSRAESGVARALARSGFQDSGAATALGAATRGAGRRGALRLAIPAASKLIDQRLSAELNAPIPSGGSTFFGDAVNLAANAAAAYYTGGASLAGGGIDVTGGGGSTVSRGSGNNIFSQVPQSQQNDPYNLNQYSQGF